MKYFSIDEFDSPDLEGSGENMDKDFLEKLDKLRGLCGFPFHINSGYRTKEHNKKVGGKATSSHLDGVAVDIHCTNSIHRMSVVKNALRVGFKRIGIAKTFIHIDLDSEKTQDLIWLY